jgi:single-stranded-DNA-specific exonuclease
MQALGLWGNPLTSQDVAIRFAPKLNALSRMETGIRPIDLYLVEDEAQAHRLVENVLSNNQSRQASQKSAEAEAMEYCEANRPSHAVFVYSEKFHRGVVGLVATKLCQEYGLPTFVGSLDEEEGVITGSARMPEGQNLNALDAMAAASDLLAQFGGHAAAAGFELKVENAESFRKRLEGFFAPRLFESAPKTWVYDAEATLTELSPAFMSWYEHLSPFGAQFQPPIFRVRNLEVAEVKVVKGGHYRLTLAEGRGGSRVSRVSLWFSPPKNHPFASMAIEGRGGIEALVEPQWNYFRGSRTLQLLIQDLRAASEV